MLQLISFLTRARNCGARVRLRERSPKDLKPPLCSAHCQFLLGAVKRLRDVVPLWKTRTKNYEKNLKIIHPGANEWQTDEQIISIPLDLLVKHINPLQSAHTRRYQASKYD